MQLCVTLFYFIYTTVFRIGDVKPESHADTNNILLQHADPEITMLGMSGVNQDACCKVLHVRKQDDIS